MLCGGTTVDPMDRFLAHLTAIDRSPNTVRSGIRPVLSGPHGCLFTRSRDRVTEIIRSTE